MSVSQDATSGRYVPATATEWTELLGSTGLSNPSSAWPCQDTGGGGNVVDVIGTMHLTPSAGLSYQQAAAGWSRLGVKLADNTANYLRNTSAPNFVATSGLLVQMFALGTNPGAGYRALNCFGFTKYEEAQLVPGPKVRGQSEVNLAAGGTNYSGVLIVVTKYDVTNGVLAVYTGTEILKPTFVAQTAPQATELYMLGDGVSSTDSVMVYAALWTGAAAEMNDTQVASLIARIATGPLVQVTGDLAVSTGAQASTTALSVAAGPPGPAFLSGLQTQLNANVQGYPQTAAALKAAVRWGNWTAAWLLNEPSGNPAAVFGGLSLTASGVTYANPGPQAGIDKAIGFDTGTDTLSAGDNFDAGANDIGVALIAKFGAAGTFDIMGKGYPAGGPLMVTETPGNLARFIVNDGVNAASAQAPVDVPTGVWLALMGVHDRSTNKLRFAWRRLDGAASSISAEASTALVGALNNGSNFVFGNAFYGAHTSMQIAYAAVAVGAGACTGLSANLAQALTNLCSAVNSQWSVSLGSDGRITISNSFWPSSIAFTDTELRDLLGFEFNFDYPATPAQLSAALGGYGNFAGGTGYLCNETSGNLSPVFGTTALTPISSPTYSNQGARGGSDKAIGFDSAADAFDGGALAEVTGADDLFLLWTGEFTGLPSGTLSFLSDVNGALTNGWALFGNATPIMQLYLAQSASGPQIASASAFHVGMHQVGAAVIDRSTGKARIATLNLTDGSIQISSEFACGNTSYASASTFRIGASAWVSALTTFQCSALYVASGPGVATGLSANLAAALQSFATYMRSQTGTAQYAAASAPAYARMMAALLPPGKLWRLVGGSVLSKLFAACGDELARVDARVSNLLDEADPSTADELLPEYELELDLEDGGTVEERQARVVARTVARQRYRPVDFQNALAPLLGLVPADVVVVERTHANAVAMGDDREIYRFFIYRNPALPGTYFLASAQELVGTMLKRGIKPTHTAGHVIESISFLCDDPFSLCDRDILGA